MKNLITGITLAAAAATATAATAPMMGGVGPSMGSTGGIFGPFRVFLGLSGFWSKKDVKVTTDMTTKYNAGYAYAPDGTQLWSGNWGVAAEANMTGTEANAPNDDINHTWPIGMTLPNAAAFRTAGISETLARQFLFDGKAPGKWIRETGDQGNGGRAIVPANVVADATTAILTNAMFAPHKNNALPNNKAWVQAADYKATGQTVNKLDYSNWGIRVEAGVGYSIMDELTLFILLSYAWNFADEKDGKNTVKDVSFETKGDDKTFKAADGSTDVKAKLNLESFKWNESKLAKGIKVTAKAEETFGVMGGLEWRPTEMIGLFAKVGVKRYALEVLYEGGDFAYPTTMSQYADAYTKENNKFKALVSQDKKSRKVTATEWPFTFGGGLRIVFMGMHCINFGIEYATFDADLSVESSNDDNKDGDNNNNSSSNDDSKKDNNNAKGAEIKLANPYGTTLPTDAQVKNDGTGIHQFMPTGDVVNTITTKVEVQDLTISAGYMLTL